MNQLITHAMNFKKLKTEKSEKFKTDKFKDKSNNDKKSEEKSEDKSNKNNEKSDDKNLNSNFIIMLKNAKNTDKFDISKNCNYCSSSYHNINECKLKNSTKQSEK